MNNHAAACKKWRDNNVTKRKEVSKKWYAEHKGEMALARKNKREEERYLHYEEIIHEYYRNLVRPFFKASEIKRLQLKYVIEEIKTSEILQSLK